jgi:hypothetical protein
MAPNLGVVVGVWVTLKDQAHGIFTVRIVTSNLALNVVVNGYLGRKTTGRRFAKYHSRLQAFTAFKLEKNPVVPRSLSLP